jgi:hypothetical protein
MIDVDSSPEEKSYIDEKAASVSKEIGIQKELLFKITFEEVEKKLGITEESFEVKSPNPHYLQNKSSIFIHFSSPILKKDIVRKQKRINKFINSGK